MHKDHFWIFLDTGAAAIRSLILHMRIDWLHLFLGRMFFVIITTNISKPYQENLIDPRALGTASPLL